MAHKEAPASHRVFVGGISWKADEQSLANFFRSYGNVVECKIIMDKVTGKSKGYGFVTFDSAETAGRVKQSTNLYFLGKMMNVGDAVRKSDKSGFGSGGYSAGGAGNSSGGGYSQQYSAFYGNPAYMQQQQQYYQHAYLPYAQGYPYGYGGAGAPYPPGWTGPAPTSPMYAQGSSPPLSPMSPANVGVPSSPAPTPMSPARMSPPPQSSSSSSSTTPSSSVSLSAAISDSPYNAGSAPQRRSSDAGSGVSAPAFTSSRSSSSPPPSTVPASPRRVGGAVVQGGQSLGARSSPLPYQPLQGHKASMVEPSAT